MAKRYGSFLLRCWHLGDDAQRLEIEHIQSGARVRVASITAAVAWISACNESPGAREVPAAAPPDDREV